MKSGQPTLVDLVRLTSDVNLSRLKEKYGPLDDNGNFKFDLSQTPRASFCFLLSVLAATASIALFPVIVYFAMTGDIRLAWQTASLAVAFIVFRVVYVSVFLTAKHALMVKGTGYYSDEGNSEDSEEMPDC